MYSLSFVTSLKRLQSVTLAPSSLVPSSKGVGSFKHETIKPAGARPFQLNLCLKSVFAALSIGACLGSPAVGHAYQPVEPFPTVMPIELTRPMAPETLLRLLNEADGLYRARLVKQATEAYLTTLELEPRLVTAWFRLGNIWQQNGKEAWAIQAYSLASRSEPFVVEASDEETRAKALLNLSLLHMKASQRALDSAQSIASQLGTERQQVLAQATSLVGELTETQTIYGGLRDQLAAIPARVFPARPKTQDSQQVTDSNQSAKAQPPAGLTTVSSANRSQFQPTPKLHQTPNSSSEAGTPALRAIKAVSSSRRINPKVATENFPNESSAPVGR
jgi:hypothetical protein